MTVSFSSTGKKKNASFSYHSLWEIDAGDSGEGAEDEDQ